ncbi:hypothetical protein ACOMYX_19530 (plasmid) [Pantoea agglomerans]|jgi:hypothetical protein|uniref:hypothetical protein n=1 Tax=Pantoea TaxID=53335 RepID=UPI0031F51526
MRLQDVAKVSVNLPDADFWIVRRGTVKAVGEPTYTFNPEHIGIKVTRTEVVLPRYLYYCLMHIHAKGMWENLATGTLTLVNIRVSDIKHIALKPQ